MSNNYSAPSATLVNSNDSGQTVQDAIEGNYSVELADILSEAWQKTKGIKRYILGAGATMYAIVFVVIFAVTMLTIMVSGADPESAGPAAILIQFIIQIAMMAIILPFSAGIFVMCMKQVQGEQPAFSDAFSCFGKTGTLLLTMILMYIMIFIGFLLFIIPGIYLSIAYVMAIPLIVDKDMGPWEALEASRKAITKHWFSMFVFLIVLSLIMFVSMLPLFIGMIWSIPMMSVAMAVLYREIFGISSY
ncbi:DUF2189 domain-containing protein [Ketobacter alkanivorans]|uniref:Glycerophosphoryl diester phosphodiesterase membrane domain-containing protein n=1 Tax=Ketobacter alkanivorans TaxID=1917421 RepID=A0A2K9LIW3_9GAMM|nr:DUF975 family protein [Ketobacter alkanivorans]AUM12177.1 hypothetical protein Kalk_07035 [Ketobacter alkanivorans]MCP5014853.1 DUF975 family protein [Ketobacter sp.]